MEFTEENKENFDFNSERFSDNNDEDSKCKKRPWTQEEDQLVLKLVDENGP